MIWTRNIDDSFRVLSELRMAIATELNKESVNE